MRGKALSQGPNEISCIPLVRCIWICRPVFCPFEGHLSNKWTAGKSFQLANGYMEDSWQIRTLNTIKVIGNDEVFWS